MKKIIKTILVLVCLLALVIPVYGFNADGPDLPYNFISSGDTYCALVDSSGALWMWGSSDVGNLAAKSSEINYTPTKVMDDVVSVSCGVGTTAVIKKDGTLWTWGKNSYGTLGNGSLTDSSEPQKIMTDVIRVTCCERIMAAVRKDGSLWAWGFMSGINDITGDETNGNASGANHYQTRPVRIMNDVADVSCSNFLIAVIKTDGSLWAWEESEDYYRTGILFDASPVKVMSDVRSVSCGDGHFAVVKKDGTLWTSGRNQYGQLAKGYVDDNRGPASIAQNEKGNGLSKVMNDVKMAVAGTDTTAIIKNDNSLWVCGYDVHGALGLGDTGMSSDDRGLHFEESQPTPLKSADNVAMITLGNEFGMFVKTDGTVWTFGTNQFGQIGTVQTESGYAFITLAPFGMWDLGWDIVVSPVQIAKDITVNAAGIPRPSGGGNAEPISDAAGFSDVIQGTTVNKTSYNAIYWAVENGIVKGYADGTFQPETICTREQFSIMLWRFAGEPDADANAVNKFTDADDLAKGARKAVAWAVEQGIVAGFSDGSFQPKADITRAQVAVMLWRYAGKPSVSGSSKFSDIGSFGSGVQNAIIWLEGNKIASGYNDGTFQPNGGCQRQHMAIFLYRYSKNIE